MCRFLLVSLKIEAILGEVTIRQRRKKLEEMAGGNGLSDAYTTTLTRIKGQKGNKSVLGWKVLMWVLYSERPLEAEELCHALGVEIGSAELDLNNVPTLRALIASCLGLVTIEASSSRVRLVHFTLQEHLLSDSTLFHSPHSAIAEVCLTYLNFGSVRELSPTLPSAPPTMPFLDYASLYWGEHTRMAITQNVKTLALRILDRFDEHISAQLLLLRHHGYRRSCRDYKERRPMGFTGLHGASYLGVAGILADLFEMKEWDVNAMDGMGFTALTWAARQGCEEVVKILLGRQDVNPNQSENRYNETALKWAIINSHEGVVRMLLERKDVNLNPGDTGYGGKLLMLAVNGREEVANERIVKMFLEREDINSNTENWELSMALFVAVRNAQNEVVKMLLERDDIDPNKIAAAECGGTPLLLAVSQGYDEVVKTLLERDDIDPNKAATRDGETPLTMAAELGYEGVVKMLLERDDINPDESSSEHTWTALMIAADCGHAEIVKLLLEHKDVDPNQELGQRGLTPIFWAVKHGHDEVVKVLLEQEDVDLNKTDEDGQTPLWWAAKGGHAVVVKNLLERDDVNPNQADTQYGRTPLSWAAERGHAAVVKTLLGRDDVNPNQADTQYGRTPLFWASEQGYEEVVRILLERDDVNLNQVDTQYGRTPLWWAGWKGHHGVVKMLLERKMSELPY